MVQLEIPVIHHRLIATQNDIEMLQEVAIASEILDCPWVFSIGADFFIQRSYNNAV
jgi:hypothetical protein